MGAVSGGCGGARATGGLRWRWVGQVQRKIQEAQEETEFLDMEVKKILQQVCTRPFGTQVVLAQEALKLFHIGPGL